MFKSRTGLQPFVEIFSGADQRNSNGRCNRYIMGNVIKIESGTVRSYGKFRLILSQLVNFRRQLWYCHDLSAAGCDIAIGIGQNLLTIVLEFILWHAFMPGIVINMTFLGVVPGAKHTANVTSS